MFRNGTVCDETNNRLLSYVLAADHHVSTVKLHIIAVQLHGNSEKKSNVVEYRISTTREQHRLARQHSRVVRLPIERSVKATLTSYPLNEE